MTKDIVETNNENETLIDPNIEEIIDNVIAIKKGSKKSRFHLYRMFNLPIVTCAKLAGYTPSYGYKLVTEYKNDPKVVRSVERILSNMPEAYRSVCKMRLPQIAQIEGKALQEYEDDPKLAIDKPQLLKQVKQGAGVDMGEKDIPAAVTINIKAIESIQIAMQDVLRARMIPPTNTDT